MSPFLNMTIPIEQQGQQATRNVWTQTLKYLSLSLLHENLEILRFQKSESCRINHNDGFTRKLIIYGSYQRRSRKWDIVTARIHLENMPFWLVDDAMLKEKWKRHGNCALKVICKHLFAACQSAKGYSLQENLTYDTTNDVPSSYRLVHS